jgi:hypothetical protein
LEGTVLIERKDANSEFYGSPVPAKDILTGRVPPPEVASKMYEIIEVSGLYTFLSTELCSYVLTVIVNTRPRRVSMRPVFPRNRIFQQNPNLECLIQRHLVKWFLMQTTIELYGLDGL